VRLMITFHDRRGCVEFFVEVTDQGELLLDGESPLQARGMVTVEPAAPLAPADSCHLHVEVVE